MDAFTWMWVALLVVLLVTVVAAAIWAIQGLVRRHWCNRQQAGADSLGVWDDDSNPRAPITAEQYRARVSAVDKGSTQRTEAGKR